MIEAVKEGVSPIGAKMVLSISDDEPLKEFERPRQLNLMSMLVNIMWNPLSIHKEVSGP